MSFYDEVKKMTEQSDKEDKEKYFKGTIVAVKLKIASAAKEGKTRVSFYGDYEYADPKKIGEYFKLQGFEYCYYGSKDSWKIIFNWE